MCLTLFCREQGNLIDRIVLTKGNSGADIYRIIICIKKGFDARKKESIISNNCNT